MSPGMLSLPLCGWRGESSSDHHVCHSARFLGAPNRVRADFCATCSYVDHPPPSPSPPALPCVHLGGGTGGEVSLPSSTGKAVVRLFACHLHGHCMPARSAGDLPAVVRRCAGCPDYLPRDPFGPSSAQMLRRAEAFLAALPDYPLGRYQGRGIVLAGGGERYFASLYITVRALRHVGCRLPIQVWYLGRHNEMPPSRQVLLAPHDVACIDADEVRRQHPARRLDGWELKVFATLHSPFEEVLFLDADCYPCRDPSFLFDEEEYRACGAIFWPDLMTTDPRLKWPAFGVPDPGRPGSVESGQFVLHKRQCWRPLHLAWFYNDHSDYYYRYGYGDKHTFEVAWTSCGQSFVMWEPRARWVDVAYVQVGPDHLPLFVHRCADKFCCKPEAFSTPQRHSGQAFHPHLPLESECWSWLGDLTWALGPGANRPGPPFAPDRIVRIGLPGHFNCSLLEHQGRLLLASRQGWLGAQVYLSELGADYQPRWTRLLDITHPRAPEGIEDPRLFLFNGRLHCAFTGLERDAPPRTLHQMVCRLDDQGRVEEVWLPEYAGRVDCEKNWQFFEHEGELYSVYTVAPHVVLRHRDRRAEKVARTLFPSPWAGYHLRGGAPPVRVGNEFYHFFHTRCDVGGRSEYAIGVYTFAVGPPFTVQRVTRGPILLPDDHDRPAGQVLSVVFPCGVMLRRDQWVLSYGYHDRECRIAVFATDQIEQQLQTV